MHWHMTENSTIGQHFDEYNRELEAVCTGRPPT
jgi:hypothetical protein